MSAKFCGECGTALTSPVRFCPNCGQPIRQPTQPIPRPVTGVDQPLASSPTPPSPPFAPVPPAQPAPSSYAPPQQFAGASSAQASEQHDVGPGQWSTSYPHTPGRPRNRLMLVGVSVVVLLLIATGVYAVTDGRLFGGDGGPPAAVSSEPDRAWRYWADDSVNATVPLGDGVVIATSGNEVVALDGSGEETWSSSAGNYVVPGPPGSDVVIAVESDDSESPSTLSVLAGNDGDELWGMEGYPIDYLDGSLIVVGSEDGLSIVGAQDGEVKWDVDPDNYVVAGNAVYVIDRDEIQKLGASDGEVQWAADASDADPADDSTPNVRANDELVVVSGQDVVAFSAGDGEQLWTVDGGTDGVDTNVYSDTEMMVSEVDFSEDANAVITVYDKDGEVAEVDSPDDSGGYLFTRVVNVGGKTYALDALSGWLYDEDHEVAEKFDGQVTELANGFYELSGLSEDDDPELRYVTLDEGTHWRMSLDSADSLALTALDGKLVVTADEEVSLYE